MLALCLAVAAWAAPERITWGPGWIRFDGREVFRSQESATSSETYALMSAVGTLISARLDWSAEGGAHPAYGTSFETKDGTTGKPVNLRGLFGDQALLEALLADSVIRKALNGATPKTLAELVSLADGGCEMSISKEMFTSFAFHHVKDGKVAVRIGLPHGCEAMRGNFTQLGLYLPVPASLAPALTAADQRDSLMENLAP